MLSFCCLYPFWFFAPHNFAQLFMHISQIVRKQMSWTKRNVRGTRRTRRKLMKIWTGTECERGSAKRRRRTNNFFIMNYSRPIGGGAQNQNRKKNKRPLLFHCFFLSVFFLLFFGPYLQKGKSINQAHWLIWNIFLLFCFATHFFLFCSLFIFTIIFPVIVILLAILFLDSFN